MNRNAEYEALLQALEETPTALEGTAERARRRLHRKRQVFGIPTASLAACFLGFMLLVNLFPPFARACGDVPVLRELAKAVAWSPSLSAAVEHDFVQPIGQSQTQNGVTASVEYVIVDQKQVSIFFTLSGDEGLEADPAITAPDGAALSGYSLSGDSFGAKQGELRSVTASFVDADTPGTLRLRLQIYQNSPEKAGDPAAKPAPARSYEDDLLDPDPSWDPDYLADFSFDLAFDPLYTAAGEHIAVNQSFLLDGQRLTLTEAEVYPTHMRINFAFDEGNTAWLKGLTFSLENGAGERFTPAVNGISASGDPDSPAMVSYWLDSPYFSNSKKLTLHITGAEWLEKDHARIHVNLADETADFLPEGVTFQHAEKREGGWILTFRAREWEENHYYQLFSSTYYDRDDTARDIRQRGSSTLENGYFEETFPLAGYTADEVWLEPINTRTIRLDPAVVISIRGT